MLKAAYGDGLLMARTRRSKLENDGPLPLHFSPLAALFTQFVQPPRPRKPAESGKTERNDPCPCGSGKKFKKCHGR